MRIVTWNLFRGGIDNGDPARMHRQLTWIRDTHTPDVLFCQELKGWLTPHDGSIPARDAEDILGMRGWLTQNSPYDSELGIFVKPEVGIRVLRPRHVHSCYTAGQCVLEIELGGEPVRLVNVHLHPTSRTLRRLDTETLRLHHEERRRAIIAGDFNSAAINDSPPPGHYPAGTDDSAPAWILERAGVCDTGLELDDTTPTCHRPFGYRADRIYHNLVGAAVTRREVHWSDDSDHALVRADITPQP